MTRQALLLIALGALAATAGPAHAQAVPPISLTQLPHVSIISPVFYWSDAADVVRMASATCPKGRPIAGGVAIQKGSASLRIQETYPDGESWVTRIVNRKTPDSTQPLEVRAFAVCLLPSARVSSIQLSQFPRLTQQSQAFSIPPGGGATGNAASHPMTRTRLRPYWSARCPAANRTSRWSGLTAAPSRNGSNRFLKTARFNPTSVTTSTWWI
jgi:hypothetical protein